MSELPPSLGVNKSSLLHLRDIVLSVVCMCLGEIIVTGQINARDGKCDCVSKTAPTFPLNAKLLRVLLFTKLSSQKNTDTKRAPKLLTKGLGGNWAHQITFRDQCVCV